MKQRVKFRPGRWLVLLGLAAPMFASFSLSIAPGPTLHAQEGDRKKTARHFGRREVVPENQVSPFERFRLTPLPPQKEKELIERSLMITHLNVVEDARARGLGPWSFGGLMTEIANKSATGIDPRQLVEWWLDEVQGTFKVAALEAWDVLSSKTRTLDKLPFRLLAIINRIDLRNNLVLGGSGAGELRFVYGLHDANECPLDVTVIFEFAVKRTTFNEIRAWGREWHQLRLIDIAKPEFKVALQQLTDQYTLRGADVDAPPNRSALAQLRVSISEGKNWRFAEFKVDVQNTGKLVQVTAKQTPKLEFRGTPTINNFLRSYRDDILGNRHQVPVRFEGEEFLTKNSNLSAGRPPTFYWDGEKLPNDLLEARHLFSLNTCSGCHARETDTDFFHVTNRRKGEAARLSKFLTGIKVEDPAGQKSEEDPTKTKVREFNDLRGRAEDLRRLIEIGPAYESTRVPLNAVH